MLSCYSHLFNDNCAANIEFFPRRIPTRDIDTKEKKMFSKDKRIITIKKKDVICDGNVNPEPYFMTL